MPPLRCIRPKQLVATILAALLLPLAPMRAEEVGTELYNEMRAMMEQESDALSRSTGSPPLRGDDAPELRLWVIGAQQGMHVTGYIVTTVSTRRYDADQRYTADGAHAPMRLTGVRTGIQYASFVPLLREIPRLHGLLLHCGGADLPTVVVDFVLNGQRFVFGGDEMTSCIDSGSRALSEIHRQLRNRAVPEQ